MTQKGMENEVRDLDSIYRCSNLVWYILEDFQNPTYVIAMWN